jgi:predicted kinase
MALVLVIMGGLPASGKSAISRALAYQIGAIQLRIDTIEQAIVRSGIADHPVGPVGYTIGYALAEDHLKQGLTVIADSVNPLPVTRQTWRAVAGAAGVPFAEVEIICSDQAEHRRRAETRTSGIPGLTPPTWEEIVERDYRPWDGDHIICDTAGRTVADCVTHLLDLLPLEGVT